MRYLTSNLFFASFVILGIGMLIWYASNESPKEEKKSILSIFTDMIFYFVATTFGLNLIFHLSEIIAFPYRILIFSSTILSAATMLITLYSVWKYGEKLWQKPKKAVSTVQLLLLIGLVNHVYIYLLYRNGQSILFILYFIGLLLFISSEQILKKIDSLLLLTLAGVVHLLLMGNQPIIYFNFTFYTLPLAILLVTLIGTLYIQRRRYQSKQN